MSNRDVVAASHAALVIAAITLSSCAHYVPPPPMPPPIYVPQQPPPPPPLLDVPPPPPLPPPVSVPAPRPPPPSVGRPAGHAIPYARMPAAASADVAPTATSPGPMACGADDLDCHEALPGHGSFQPAPEMWVDTPAVLEFAVGRTMDSLTREMGEAPAPAQVRNVNIGRCMRVTLEPNPSIRITSANGVTTRLARDMDRASWSWSVIPLNPGSPTLRARVEVLAQSDGRCSDQVLDQYTERVPVQIQITRWKGFLRALGEAKNLGDLLKAVFSSWEGAVVALGALLAALGALFGVKRLRRRTRRKPVKRAG